MGTDDFAPSSMAPHFERVESFLGVALTDDRADAVVRYERDGNVLVTKTINARDVARVHQAMVRAREMFLATAAPSPGRSE